MWWAQQERGDKQDKWSQISLKQEERIHHLKKHQFGIKKTAAEDICLECINLQKLEIDFRIRWEEGDPNMWVVDAQVSVVR